MIPLKYQERNTVNFLLFLKCSKVIMKTPYICFQFFLLYYFSGNYVFTASLEDLLDTIIEYKCSAKCLNENNMKRVIFLVLL